MPDATSPGGDDLLLTGRVLVAAGVVFWIGAVVALGTGDELRVGRSHTDAVIVLVVLGVAALLAAAIVLVERADRRRTPEPQRNDYEDS